MSLNATDWGVSNWGEFIWPEPGKGIFGYSGQVNPTEMLVFRVLRPFKPILKKFQPKDYSDGMDLYVYNKAGNEELLEIQIKCTKAEYDTFKTWYDTKANGAANQLYFIDPYGAEHLIRILDEALHFEEQAYNKWLGSLLLRKEG